MKTERRILQDDIIINKVPEDKKLSITICFGTSCFLRGAQTLYTQVMEYLTERDLLDKTEFTASFCGKQCKKGPVLSVNGKSIEHCTLEMAVAEIEKIL
jgi:NADH-quinone oxidoreductase subunit G